MFFQKLHSHNGVGVVNLIAKGQVCWFLVGKKNKKSRIFKPIEHAVNVTRSRLIAILFIAV